MLIHVVIESQIKQNRGLTENMHLVLNNAVTKSLKYTHMFVDNLDFEYVEQKQSLFNM